MGSIKSRSIAAGRIGQTAGYIFDTCSNLIDDAGLKMFSVVEYAADHLDIPSFRSTYDPFPLARIEIQNSPYTNETLPPAFKYATTTISIYIWMYEEPAWDGFQSGRSDFCQRVLLSFQDKKIFPYPNSLALGTVWMKFAIADYAVDHHTAVGQFSGLIEPPLYVSRIDLKFRIEIVP